MLHQTIEHEGYIFIFGSPKKDGQFYWFRFTVWKDGIYRGDGIVEHSVSSDEFRMALFISDWIKTHAANHK